MSVGGRVHSLLPGRGHGRKCRISFLLSNLQDAKSQVCLVSVSVITRTIAGPEEGSLNTGASHSGELGAVFTP